MMESKKKITRNLDIEELVKILPESVSYLMEKGIRCLRCGEPIWGTIESASTEKGFNQDDIGEFVNDLNAIYERKAN